VGKLYNVREGVIKMTKANALRGWRSIDEDPIYNTHVLLVLHVKSLDENCIILLRREEIDSFLNDDDYEVLAWQYSPIWEEE
jgi:hypothetical protein